MYMHDWGGWGGIVGLFWVVIVIGLGALLVWLAGSRRVSLTSDESPEEILKRRYARGEISKEQYESMHRDLQT
jgi:putative membrane protein